MGANAQTAVPAFTAGQVLTAAQQTQINTGIPVFATTTTRDAAFGGTGEKTLAEGQYAYIEANNETQYYDGSAWKNVLSGSIVQIVTATTTTQTSSASATFADTTLTATITPTSASNTILVTVHQNGCGKEAANNYMQARLMRGSTEISRFLELGGYTVTTATNYFGTASTTYKDSPATTSATTYKTQFANQTASGLVYVQVSSAMSTITLMEIAA